MGGVVSAITSVFSAFNPVSFAIQMIASAVISKIFAPSPPSQSAQAPEPNPGSRAQTPPGGDNKLPIVYGHAWTGGIVTDLSITTDNQTLYYVFALSEVTNTETGGTPDVITFGDVYWGGKKCVFDATDQTKVLTLLDPSTGESQDVSGYINVYLYSNGSFSPANSTTDAITIMSASNLTYKWNNAKTMTNCAFAIIKLKYSQSRNIVGLSSTNFELTNARKAPGDCFLDYLTSTRYGAAIPVENIDTTSLTALNTYSNQTITYTLYSGGTSTMKRFEFNGTLDTAQKIMKNIQSMADCCDCLVKYNEITGLWGVIVQKPTYTVAMNINDTNMIGAISVSPIDISNSFNIIETKFPDGSQQDSFNAATFDLSEINPSLMFPNEPVNKQSVSLYLTNNSVTAQYIANRMLEAAREDLQIQCEINYIGLELEAGDIVTITNVNYGWSAKLFRIMKVVEKFGDDGTVTATLSLSEYNPAIYDDYNVTEFTPAPNSGLSSPVTFGTVYPPVVIAQYPNTTNPTFTVRIQTSSAGISDYAEIYYSAYQYPSEDQLIFVGTTAIQPVGVPYVNNTYMPDVTLSNIPAGDWYLFTRMVNSLASSNYSLASAKFVWRPTTFQYVEKYLSVAYADNITGTSNFNLNPENRLYYGLCNQSTNSPSITPSQYTWYLANPTFGTDKYLAYSNRTGRKFSFATDNAAYAAGTASFVPLNTNLYDPSTWSSLPFNKNIIDLDQRTGQLIGTGTTTTATGEIAIVNTQNGQVVASLQKFLDFGGPTTFTGDATTLTIDIYGRVVGFSAADSFYMTIDQFTATSGQTVFSVSRSANYILGQCLVYENGILLQESEYTDASGSVTLDTGATLGDDITIISMRAISTNVYYSKMSMSVASVSSNVVTWNSANMPWDIINIGDKITFANTGSPTQYTVTNVNLSTFQITFSATVTGVSAGDSIYFYRAAASSYPVFSRYTDNLTNVGSYIPTEWSFDSGFEIPYINGTALTAYDYNLTSNTFASIPNIFTGDLDIIQFTGNNLTTPTGSIVNMLAYTVIGQTGYSFTSIVNALNIYMNGALLVNGTDYTSTTTDYTLSVTPANNTSIMSQQTFARYGAA
ncbi:host specificity protein J [Methylophilaceae phage P19250A]|nr:host specificity protein J [Methylophilaceae phage P19250A]